MWGDVKAVEFVQRLLPDRHSQEGDLHLAVFNLRDFARTPALDVVFIIDIRRRRVQVDRIDILPGL